MSSETLSIGYNPIGVSAVTNKLKLFCEKQGIEEGIIFQNCVVAAEALNNIIQHSPASANDGFIKVAFNFNKDSISINIVYWCPEFSPPEQAGLPELESLSGRGWHIIQSYMDDISYNHHLGMNSLTLTKHLAFSSVA